MTAYRAHGEYLHDYTYRAEFGFIRGKSLPREDHPLMHGWKSLLQCSPFVRPYVDKCGWDGLINKGWVIIRREDDRATLLNNHDGTYTVWSCDWCAFTAQLDKCPFMREWHIVKENAIRDGIV